MAFSARVGRWFVAGSMVVGLGGCGGSVAIDFVGADGGNGSGGAGGSGGEPCPEGETRIGDECVDDGVDPGPGPDPDCPLTNVKLDQVNARWQGGFQSVVMLRNVSDSCTVDLSGLSLGIGSDVFDSVELTGSLEPDAVFTIASDTIGRAVDQTAPEVFFDGNNAWLGLCAGDCDVDDGSNVLDLVILGSFDGVEVVGPEPPSGTFFDGVALARLDGDSELYGAYYRTNVSDGYFTAADWSGALIIDPNVGGDGGALRPIEATQVLGLDQDPTYGSYFLFSNDSGVTDAYVGYEATGPAGFRPRYVTGRFFYGAGLATAFVVGGLGSPTFPSDGAIHLLFDEFGMSVNGVSLASEPGEGWHQVEFQNIDWVAGSFDVWLDGALLVSSVSMNAAVSEGLLGDIVGVYAVGTGNATGFTEIYLVE